jgi:hypothetical protein
MALGAAVVGTVTWLRLDLDGRKIVGRFQQGKGFLLSRKCLIRFQGPHSLLLSRYRGDISPVVKRLENETAHTAPKAKVKNE